MTRSDQFDFLIDIVPREEVPKVVRRPKEEVVGVNILLLRREKYDMWTQRLPAFGTVKS